ncbi:hypothetical protein BJY21_004126 [Kineosphaera limosa]|uniref:Uncharacterized protein n=1 Tax=Kineosphaera limosa NBRC 100340 TaxID=1184609 RepID=K6VDW2_9MICO|nr:hypothetical protein [Kineosphaera limosa]NYE02942.1 hypothetical protein [Kineosphaera limosa]GAB94373.1 hypothetical protein KILIM_004_01650 [Kineosphaera limosa NBRC 100340]
MGADIVYRKVSWTIEAGVLDQVQARVPRGQQSSYATEALRRQLERDDLADLVADLVEANGPLDEGAVARFGDALR